MKCSLVCFWVTMGVFYYCASKLVLTVSHEACSTPSSTTCELHRNRGNIRSHSKQVSSMHLITNRRRPRKNPSAMCSNQSQWASANTTKAANFAHMLRRPPRRIVIPDESGASRRPCIRVTRLLAQATATSASPANEDGTTNGAGPILGPLLRAREEVLRALRRGVIRAASLPLQTCNGTPAPASAQSGA